MDYEKINASRAALESKDRQERIEKMLAKVLEEVHLLRAEVNQLINSSKKKEAVEV